MGFNEAVLNRVVVRLAQFFLFKDCRMVFGHDWRTDGVMRAVGTLAEIAAANHTLISAGRDPRMLNLVPTGTAQLSRVALNAQKASEGILRVHAIQDMQHNADLGGLISSVAADPNLEALSAPSLNRWSETILGKLWVLRAALTKLLDTGGRICLGGKTSGYLGYYAGVAEDAYLALTADKPLYLIGGFGGATYETVAALRDGSDSNALKPPSDHQANAPALSSTEEALAKHLAIPLNGLASKLGELGVDKLCETNGLSKQENEELFECSDIEHALQLIWIGMQNRSS